MYININGTRIKTEGILSYGKNGNGITIVYKNNTVDIPLNGDGISDTLQFLDNKLNKVFNNYLEYFTDLKNSGYNPKRILDIGANIGEFRTELKEIWNDTSITMIEANRECEKHLSKLDSPFYIEVLGKKDDETVNFYLSKDMDSATGNSIYPEKTSFYTEDRVNIEQRKTKRLTSLLPEETFDIIKLDTQGSELDIIKGGLDIILRARYVLIETAVKEYNIGSPMEDEIIEYMNLIGFNKYKTVGTHIWPPLESMINDRTDIKRGDVFQRDLIFYKK